MSEGTEAAAVAAPVAAVAAADEPAALVLGGYGAHFLALAKRHIEANEGDSRDQAPKIRFGITRKMLGDYLARKSPASADELAGITEELAYKILHDRVWTPIVGEKLPEPVASALFDIAVRRGAEEAGKLLQTGIRKAEDVALKVDGRIGRQTLGAIAELVAAGKEIALAEHVLAERTTAIFRLGDGKLFGRDVNFARAALLVGRAALKAKTGGLL